MTDRNQDPAFSREEIEREDPLGEQAFAESGFADAPNGEPAFDAGGLEDDSVDKRAGRAGQKVAGIADEAQHLANTPSEQRPDSSRAVIRERGGESKGDPAVGGTRPD